MVLHSDKLKEIRLVESLVGMMVDCSAPYSVELKDYLMVGKLEMQMAFEKVHMKAALKDLLTVDWMVD